MSSQIILFLNSHVLLTGNFRTPEIWMSAHFLLLGFTVMVAMGAMYQLVPVVFLTPIWSIKFGIVQFIVTATGIVLLSILLGLQPSKAIYGGVLAIVGIIMFILQMMITISKQKEKNILTSFVIGAIICFLLTIAIGLLLAWSFAFGGINHHQSLLYSHITFGVAGWFTLLIFGFSYKLVPMFSLSHGFTMKWAKPAFISYTLGLISLVASFWSSLTIFNSISWLLLLIGFMLFTLDMKDILNNRVKKKLDKPFTFSLLAIINGLTVHLIAFIFSIMQVNSALWSWLIFIYIISWIVFSILGYLYKIVPFLWWTHKYSERIGKEKVPTLKEMINEKLSVYLFVLFIIALLGVIASLFIKINLLLYVFTGIFFITTFIYSLSIIRVLFK
ncbi:hypothetical protein ACLIA0_08910 [Bacillaceae bacterium W0354]